MKISQLSGSDMLNAIKALANSGTMIFYSGTPPTNPDTALSGNTALATFTFSSTAFGSNTLTGGYQVTTASFVASSVTAANTGAATFARLYESDGTTVIADLTIGTSATDIVINSTAITAGGNVSMTSLTLSMPVD